MHCKRSDIEPHILDFSIDLISEGYLFDVIRYIIIHPINLSLSSISKYLNVDTNDAQLRAIMSYLLATGFIRFKGDEHIVVNTDVLIEISKRIVEMVE